MTRDPPHAALRVEAAEADRDDQLLAAAQAVAPGWHTAPAAVVTPIPGGITNLLYQLRAPGRPTVLVRIYGARTELVIDRPAELRLLGRLSRAGFAPPLHGTFDNGRVEGFLEGFRALQPHELGRPELVPGIAQRLAELHRFAPPSPQVQLWQTLRGWLDTARGLHFAGERAERLAALDLDGQARLLDHLERRVRDRAAAPAGPGQARALRPVLAHNDLLAGNVLYHPDADELRFIDYEYGATAYAAFDVANHLCEYAGFDSDFARHFPDAAARAAFVRAYLAAEGAPPPEEEVRDFCAEVEELVIVDHLWWGCWAVVQAAFSPIAFDFLDYARLRREGCQRHRQELGVLPD